MISYHSGSHFLLLKYFTISWLKFIVSTFPIVPHCTCVSVRVNNRQAVNMVRSQIRALIGSLLTSLLLQFFSPSLIQKWAKSNFQIILWLQQQHYHIHTNTHCTLEHTHTSIHADSNGEQEKGELKWVNGDNDRSRRKERGHSLKLQLAKCTRVLPHCCPIKMNNKDLFYSSLFT